MQSVLSRNWTRIAVSISCDDNHYTTGIFDGSQIKELMKFPIFDKTLSEAELFTSQLLKSVVKNFLGNHRSAEYEKEIEKLRKSFR